MSSVAIGSLSLHTNDIHRRHSIRQHLRAGYIQLPYCR